MNVFLDSSALAKRYLEEQGSDEVEKICAKANQITVSIICLPEIYSAINRKKRDGNISNQHFQSIKQILLKEFEDFMVCPLSTEIITVVLGYLERYSLKTMDAIHLASAEDFQADLFVSSDVKQLEAARTLRLKVQRV